MNTRMRMGVFATEEDVLAATRALRADGFDVVDVYAPYAIHGIDEALGLAPSRLPWVCFLCGAAGALLALGFQYWTAAVDWPIDVGGKPDNSLPAFIPVAFELTVLFAGLGTVAALLVRCRLWPGRRPVLRHPRVTDDRFALVVREHAAEHAPGRLASLLALHNVVETAEVTS